MRIFYALLLMPLMLFGQTNLGYTEIGGTALNLEKAAAYLHKYTASSSGTLTSMSMYQGGAVSAIYRMFVYLDDGDGTPDAGDTKVGFTDPDTTATVGWKTLSISGSIVSGNTYWLGFITSFFSANTFSAVYDANGLTFYKKSAMHGTIYAGEPTNLPATWGTTLNNHQVSLYLTYTPAAAAETADSRYKRPTRNQRAVRPRRP